MKVSFDRIVDKIYINVKIRDRCKVEENLFVPIDENTVDNQYITAKVDTGATICCINLDLARKLFLSPVGKKRISTANGDTTGNLYCVDIMIDGNVYEDFYLVGLPAIQTEMLLGMNYLSTGDAYIKTSSGRTEFYFEKNI